MLNFVSSQNHLKSYVVGILKKRHFALVEVFIMSGSSSKCLLFSILLALILISSEASSRFPKHMWEQMLPKKLPSPSSAPSKGSNFVATSSTDIESQRKLPSSSDDGKI
ncbi:hypothetical protein ACH5RR_026467 [Cinchona calisaya]|uniref:Uncharacterized protein n=1 Tax=Cinchona calisaya TaxID=153742 RepID=A0ABD2Z631_9GENT